MQRGEALAQLAGLRVAQVDAVADLQLIRGFAEQRRLHLAGALPPVEPQPGGQMWPRQARGVGGTGGEIAASQRRNDAASGTAHDGQREQRRRARRERAVGVEQGRPVQPRPGRHLGDRRLGGCALEAAGPAAVDELQRGQRFHRGHRRGAARGQLAR